MGLHYQDLDSVTRAAMRAEVQADIDADRLYRSPRLSEEGARRWPDLLLEAASSHDDDFLESALAAPGMLNTHEQSHRKGIPYTRRVPSDAARGLAQGEFNRFYLRGLATRAVDEERGIEVYRGRSSQNPRPESLALEGAVLDPAQLLADLRQDIQVDRALGLPPGPNSGMTGRLAERDPDQSGSTGETR